METNLQTRYCANCKHGESMGLSVKCRRILQDSTIVLANGQAFFDHEIAYVIVPMVFSCADYEDREDMAEEDIL